MLDSCLPSARPRRPLSSSATLGGFLEDVFDKFPAAAQGRLSSDADPGYLRIVPFSQAEVLGNLSFLGAAEKREMDLPVGHEAETLTERLGTAHACLAPGCRRVFVRADRRELRRHAREHE